MKEELNQENSVIFNLIVDHVANPLDQRSITQYCADMNISEATYYRVRKTHSKAIAASVNDRRKDFMPALKAHAYKSLGARLSKSDNALKLFFQLSGELVEKTEQTLNLMTPEQKREKVKELMEKLGNRLGPDSEKA